MSLTPLRATYGLALLAAGLAGPRPRQAVAPTWRLVRDARIGSANGPQDSFGLIEGLLPARDGGILVLQQTSVRRYAPDGKLVSVIGRRGRGPGEFVDARHLGWLGDTLWVQDLMLRRVTFFLPDGTVAHTLTANALPLPNTLPTAPQVLLRGGAAVTEPGVNAAALVDHRVDSLPVFLLRRDGAVLDTLDVFSQRHEMMGLAGAGGSLMVTRQPFRDTPLLSGFPDGSGLVIVHRAVTDRHRFEVLRFTASGRLESATFYRYAPKRLKADAVKSLAESVSAHMARRFQSGRQTARLRHAIEHALYTPRSYPPVSAVFGSTDGSVWVGRERVLGAVSREWWIIGGTGKLLARTEAPTDTELMAATRDEVWGVQHDSLGVPYVVRYRVVRPRP